MFKTFVFADPHCGPETVSCRARRPSEGLYRIESLCRDACDSGADLIVCLGDLCDGSWQPAASGYLYEAGRILRSTGKRIIVLPGNHDLIAVRDEEFYSCVGLSPAPFSMKAGDLTFVFIDGCYTDDGRRYGPDSDWKNSYAGDGQPEFLEKLLKCSPDGERFIFFSHQPIDPDCEPRHVLRNSSELCFIMRDFGRGRIVSCVAGHYHPGRRGSRYGIDFITLPAVCEGDGRDLSSRRLIIDS